ncbi:hypothetical protein D9757_007305 [Collybiopsis confluens]|uniref:Uncharacterized protein n=1 Tax=Collybiopsis confluens TaxID=2823264 RepID=A0A8H5HGP5_9AGAR|nr:hypothetical protein D9757_007305 [Collybiopsis confluens]
MFSLTSPNPSLDMALPPRYSPASPFISASPHYSPMSPSFTPVTPLRKLSTLVSTQMPLSPRYSPISPTINLASPQYSPTSPGPSLFYTTPSGAPNGRVRRSHAYQSSPSWK